MKLFILSALFVSASAMADFSLDAKQGQVVCTGEDNQSWVLNAARTTVKFTVEGESRGAKPILKRARDGDSFASYTTEEGTLTLDDRGDSFQFAGDRDAQPVECK